MDLIHRAVIPAKLIGAGSLLITFGVIVPAARAAGEFEEFLKPLFAENCTKCHGGEKVKGKVDLKAIETEGQFLANPELIEELVEVIDAHDMPPEDEPDLEAGQRARLLASLKGMLRRAAAGGELARGRLLRLNRFQYNNSVKDLFALDRDIFHLPEKLMTRHGDYLGGAEMPVRVEVSCLSLQGGGGMKEVSAFPKDLRAAHGFDNQANQLTLSPLLLDAFLKLSVSIVESPDFNEGSVGIWGEFFAEPKAGTDLRAEIDRRLTAFLWQAFRGPVERTTRDRYTAYALGKIEGGLSFTEGMKKVASAALSSPMFLYRSSGEVEGDELYALASRLSFFLWGSGPDMELLRLAKTGELGDPEVLDATVDRMLADPKIERFLDAFPGQWMQLENVLAATPDPKKARLFSIDPDRPAGVQMVLEPLLLFDAVFVEDRPIVELIAPEFGYQSEFLKDWYQTDLKPPKYDAEGVQKENRAREERKRSLQEAIKTARAELDGLINPVKAKLLEERKRKSGAPRPVDLEPYAAWEFDGDLRDSVGSLHLKPQGEIRYEDGMVVLERSFLQSPGLPFDLKAKTLEVWLKVPDVNQRGGGVMGIQGPGDFFDTIVLGERKPQHWISGSNRHSRTLDFPESTPETQPDQRLHLVMVYQDDGTTTLYRNGKPYGKPYRKGQATFPKDKSSVIFGLRHLPPGGNKFLKVKLARARLYTRALNAEEVAASAGGAHYVSDKELVAALTPDQRQQKSSLEETLRASELALQNVPPPEDLGKMRQQAQKRFDDGVRAKLRARHFERVPADDPRYGGVITNAAMLSMTSGPTRTHPIARGAWIIEAIFNDPPPPPPNDVPPLNEDAGGKNLTIREKFARHRENPDCAGCHSRLDPLGFALENYDITGRWRDKYENGRDVDASGTLMRKHPFDGIVGFKETLVKEDRRFARAFTAHLMRFALASELTPADSLAVDAIVGEAEAGRYKLRSLIREVVRSERFLRME